MISSPQRLSQFINTYYEVLKSSKLEWVKNTPPAEVKDFCRRFTLSLHKGSCTSWRSPFIQKTCDRLNIRYDIDSICKFLER